MEKILVENDLYYLLLAVDSRKFRKTLEKIFGYYIAHSSSHERKKFYPRALAREIVAGAGKEVAGRSRGDSSMAR